MSRVWFVTSTSTGLGKAILERVLAAGERIAATSRNAAGLAPLQERYPDQLLPVTLDLTNQEDVVLVLNRVVQHFGRIDVVVNNAGYAIFGEIEGTPLSDARQLFDVQFWGPVYIMKEIARIFREQKTGGYLFNISTAGGYSANALISYYTSSKFALEGFTQSFLKEMDPTWNIKGAIIEPGGFDSEWRGASANMLPIHPAYDYPTNPAAMFRELRKADFAHLGSSSRMAEAIFKLSSEPKLPLRVQFGSDTLWLIKQQAQQTISHAEKWAHVARSTDKEGMDGEAYAAALAASPLFQYD
ncbi:NAD(P)-binding protein [Hymenopellis radicata]|nr:NAD(P)-binding protein [Hymenopellis radicata]